jgi:hypothetical protein
MMRFFQKLHTPKFYSDFAAYLAADSLALLRKLPRAMDDLFLDAWNKSLANEASWEAERRAAIDRFMAIMDLCGMFADGWEAVSNAADDADKQTTQQSHDSLWS